MTEFGVVIAPGCFDATPRQARAAWDEYRARGEIILGTEYGSGKFDAAFDVPDWGYFRGNGECVVSWAAETFQPAWKNAGHADRIGKPFYRGGNPNARTPVTVMPLRIGDRMIRFRVTHMPAHIQAGDGFRRTTPRVIQQAAAWVSALAVLGKWSRRSKRNNPRAAEVIGGDWNVDMHRAHWRAVIRTALGLRCVKPLTKGGDLGGRLVSWPFYRGLRVVSTELLPPQDGFDHRAVLIRFSIKGA